MKKNLFLLISVLCAAVFMLSSCEKNEQPQPSGNEFTPFKIEVRVYGSSALDPYTTALFSVKEPDGTVKDVSLSNSTFDEKKDVKYNETLALSEGLYENFDKNKQTFRTLEYTIAKEGTYVFSAVYAANSSAASATDMDVIVGMSDYGGYQSSKQSYYSNYKVAVESYNTKGGDFNKFVSDVNTTSVLTVSARLVQ